MTAPILVEVDLPAPIEVTVSMPAPIEVEVANAGVPGRSAYDLALESGFVGSLADWLASLQGADGDGVGAYTHIQETAAAVWTPINHELGFDPAAFVLIGDDGFQYDGFVVQYLIPGVSLRISQDVALSGRLYMS